MALLYPIVIQWYSEPKINIKYFKMYVAKLSIFYYNFYISIFVNLP